MSSSIDIDVEGEAERTVTRAHGVYHGHRELGKVFQSRVLKVQFLVVSWGEMRDTQ